MTYFESKSGDMGITIVKDADDGNYHAIIDDFEGKPVSDAWENSPIGAAIEACSDALTVDTSEGDPGQIRLCILELLVEVTKKFGVMPPVEGS